MSSRFPLRVLWFLLAFSLEIRVAKATEIASELTGLPLAKSVMQEPRGCLAAHAETCAVKTGDGEKFEIQVQKSKVVLDRATTVIVSKNDLILVGGTVWVHANGEVNVRSEFGVARASQGSQGEFWVSRSEKRMTVSSISSSALLLPRGSDETLLIEPGLENFVSGVQKDGSAETGLPTAIPFADHLTRWARLFSGTKAQFERQVSDFHSTWVEASRHAAEIHRSLLERQVASAKAEERLRQVQRAKVEQENREMRNLFRKKTLEAL